ncbi:S-adenosylmethionine decarboxylase proenzyme 3 [Selaginella moellendorffii]|nr:S-adenosylmethionine decarboxylase proenzyme 3 [Selaginella moellendorffii]|eukprot:XP_002983556.2 S-adenosylmethionine decarboxylase proenzyme 3 [Selaginella moellendorffii]
MVGMKDTFEEPAMPTPGFEGFEKRLEVEFFPAAARSLRSLSRDQIDSFLNVAECTIVSQLSNGHFDSYVLSESSLFIYPHRIVIKTCGTTRLLKALPKLLAVAASIGLARVVRCKYTRGSFLFPEVQPFPHHNFDEEVRTLDEHFGSLHSSKHVVMGDDRQKWHVYVASESKSDRAGEAVSKSSNTIYTLEVCMTELDKSVARSFFKSASIVTGEDMTRASGINSILPRSQICDFAFDPCGYSMNGLENGAHSTIHITPEDGFSYASFECMGYDPAKTGLNALIDRVVRCFKPGFFSVCVHAAPPVSTDSVTSPLKSTGSTWDKAISAPVAYACSGSHKEELPGGSAVVYHTFQLAKRFECGPTQVIALADDEEEVAADSLNTQDEAGANAYKTDKLRRPTETKVAMLQPVKARRG